MDERAREKRLNKLREADNCQEEYHAIIRFIQEHGYSPTIDEIVSMVSNTNSKRIVHKRLKKLQGLGLIQSEMLKPRTITVTGFEYVETGKGWLNEGERT